MKTNTIGMGPLPKGAEISATTSDFMPKPRPPWVSVETWQWMQRLKRGEIHPMDGAGVPPWKIVPWSLTH